MSHPPVLPVNSPAAWTRAELTRDTSWIRVLSTAEIAEIEAAVNSVRRRGLDLLEISPENFALPGFGRELQQIGDDLEHGRGIVQLRGLPVERLDRDDCKRMIWGLGTYLGVGLSQSRNGDYLGEVTDLGVTIDAADARGYRSKGLSRFHTDRCDVVGLLCVVKAKNGGESRVVSSPAVHNEVLRRRPDLMSVLYEDWWHSRQGEEAPGEGRAFPCPVFARDDERFASQLSFLYTESAQRFAEVPRFTPRHLEAAALLSDLANELYVESPFEVGDLQLLNNLVTWHCRAGYEDHEETERRRLLYRLWLATPNSRKLPASYRDSWGAVEPGVVRGGVISAAGWRDVAALHRRQQEVEAAG